MGFRTDSKFRRRSGLYSRHSNGQPSERRLHFEPLEDRRLLATITVTSLADNLFPDGAVTLREAIRAANLNMSVDGSTAGSPGGDTVVFDPGLAGKTISLFGELEITESLAIDASGLPDGVTLNAQNNSRVLNFSALTGDLSLDRLTITGGRTIVNYAAGGGIRFYSDGNLTLASSTVTRNSTTGDDADGGGVFAIGDVTLDRSIITHNNTSGDSGDGGGIYTQSSVTLFNSTVSRNRTTGSGAKGGGIYAAGGGSLTNTTVSGNTTASVLSSGGGIFVDFGDVSLLSSTVSGNRTLGNNSRGGGIAGIGGAISLSNSTVSGNVTEGSNSYGGGIYTYSGDLTFDASTITNNSTEGNSANGGGVFVANTAANPLLRVQNTVIADNTAQLGIAPDVRPDMTSSRDVDYSLIGNTSGTGVTAGTGTGNLLNVNPMLGPLQNNGGPTLTHAPRPGSQVFDAGDPGFDVVATPFDQRGEPFLRGVGSRIDIGAYERQSLAPSSFIVNTLTDEFDYSNADVSLREAINSANGSEGDDTITFDTGLAGGTILLGGSELEVTNTLDIDASGLTGGIAVDAQQQSRVLKFSLPSGNLSVDGLTIRGGNDSSDYAGGGGILFLSDGTLSLSNSVVTGNQTFGSRGGGGIRTDDGALLVTNSTVSENNTASLYASGGGIRTLSGAVTLENSTVTGNSTLGDRSDGGGIYTSYGAIVLTHSTVSQNKTVGLYSDGGGITSSAGAVTLNNSVVSGNSTEGGESRGGGLFASAGVVTLNQSSVVGNSATGQYSQGGGIFTGADTLTLHFSTVSGNWTERSDGGGIMAYGDLELTDSTVSGNITYGISSSGGGIFAHGDVLISRSTISGNSTAGDGSRGGGLFSRGSEISLNNSTLSGNSTAGSNSYGGGIFNTNGDLVLISSTITGNFTTGASSNGGGVFVANTAANPLFRVQYSIIADNSVLAAFAPDVRPDATSTYDVDYSLIGDTANSGINVLTGVGNLLNVDPMLGPLQNNGGPTFTHQPMPGSPAIDVKDVSLILSYDQRGAPFTREYDDPLTPGVGRDMGAIEVQPIPMDADFDNDGDVDGFDFLEWQRGFSTTYDANDLAQWQIEYGQGAPVAASSTNAAAVDFVLSNLWFWRAKPDELEIVLEEQIIDVVVDVKLAPQSPSPLRLDETTVNEGIPRDSKQGDAESDASLIDESSWREFGGAQVSQR